MKDVLIINPFSSQEYLSDQFKKHQIHCTALFTDNFNDIPPYSRPDPKLFDEQIFIKSTNPQIFLNALANRKFDYIINGSEEVTPLTDRLTEIMLPQFANSSKSSGKRFDKYLMQNAVGQSGLSCIDTKKIHIRNFNHDQLDNLNYPIFCKPVNGYASIGAFLGESKEQLLDRFQFFAKNFDDYLIQEYVKGTEYVIDSFSLNGAHYINSVLRYQKENYYGQPIYRYIEVEKDLMIWDKCTNYIRAALDALEMKNGFAHNEVIIDENGNIKLIELNNRISGGKGALAKITKLCNLIPQEEMLIHFLKTGKIIKSDYNKMHGFSRCLDLFNFKDGIIKDPHQHLLKFDSVKEVIMLKKIGSIHQISAKSVSLIDSACMVILHHHDYQKLENDSAEIYGLEKQGQLV